MLENFVTKGDILIGMFSYPYLFVYCKNINERFYTFWKVTILFWHTKILEIFDRVVSSESISKFGPVFEFGHSTKIRVFWWCNCFPIICKANCSFSNKSLVKTLTPDVSRLQLLWWLSSRCGDIIIRYKAMLSLTTAL